MPSSGLTPGRCTSSTRPPAATCRWLVMATAGLPPCRRPRARTPYNRTPYNRKLPTRTPRPPTYGRFPARPARAGRLPDLSPQALDDLVVPFVGPDEPVPLGGNPH